MHGNPGACVRLTRRRSNAKGEHIMHDNPGTRLPEYPDTRARLTRRRSTAKKGSK